MPTYKLTCKEKVLKGEITLSGSKSISNRVLIIQALCEEDFRIQHLSNANDTVIMQRLLSHDEESILDAGDAGTTFRFLTAYLALLSGKQVLTGSSRMLERPIGVLVKALRELGADIEYLAQEGFPPLRIGAPKGEWGSELSIVSNVSSQFISALLLIAPILPNGLKLFLTDKMVSRPYVQMTLDLMREFGVESDWDTAHNVISVPHQSYQARPFTVEADWSSASYWYAIAALSDEVDFQINGLFEDSFQGDSQIRQCMKQFGVFTEYNETGIRLTKIDIKAPEVFEWDCLECPDIAQTLAVVCAAKQTETKLTGLQTLQIKETRRIDALRTELEKYGCTIDSSCDTIRVLAGINMPTIKNKKIVTQTYGDHRMAMAFAPLAILYKQVYFDSRDVVRKSYPNFWCDLESMGFKVQK